MSSGSQEKHAELLGKLARELRTVAPHIDRAAVLVEVLGSTEEAGLEGVVGLGYTDLQVVDRRKGLPEEDMVSLRNLAVEAVDSILVGNLVEEEGVGYNPVDSLEAEVGSILADNLDSSAEVVDYSLAVVVDNLAVGMASLM